MADLPDYIPEHLAAEYARQRAEHDPFPDDVALLDRLINRPCMAKVYKTLEVHLSSPETWAGFLTEARLATLPVDTWRDTIKPAREEFNRQRGRAINAGRELLAALRHLTEDHHGYRAPSEVAYPARLLSEAAIRKGYPDWSARELFDPLWEDSKHRLEELIQGFEGPSPLSVPDILEALVHSLEGWKPGRFGDMYDEQNQGTKRPQVYVRAVDKAFRRNCELEMHGFPALDALPYGRLLSYDNLARLTRAALDLPDEPSDEPPPSNYLSTPVSRAAKAAAWKSFNAEDVRRALEAKAE